MPSPFSVFRKHQKAMLAVVCLLAMISFVFLPIIGQSFHELSGGARNSVVVTSRYGDLRETDLRQLRWQHQTVVNFLGRALAEVGYKADPRWTGFMLQRMGQLLGSLPPEELQGWLQRAWLSQVERTVQEEFGPSTERNLADTWVLAQRARELGIVVSDKAVIDYIRTRTAASLPEDRARQIIEALGVGQHQLLEAFRNELLSGRLKQMFEVSLGASTPAQRWEDYQRLKRQASVELAALNVADFVAKVPAPDEKTLVEFFDRHKTRAANPNSPEPGFREPYRATVEYFKAEYEKFVDLKSVTDEEIRKYYDEHKEEFVKQELPKPEEPKAGPAKPARAAQEKPAAKPQEKAPEKPKDAPKDKAKDSGKSSSLWKSARVSLVAFAEKDKEKGKSAAGSKPAESKPAEKKPVAPAKPEPKPEAKPVVKSEPKPEPKPEMKPVVKAEPKPVAKVEPKPEPKPEVKPEAKPVAKAEPKPQYQALDQVRDQIRERLAREKATKKMRAMLEPIRDQLRRHFAQLARAQGRKEELPKFDAAGVAKANGLTLHRLEMVSQRDVAGRDIAGSRTNDQQTFEQHVFGVPGLGRPALSQDLEANMYLFSKIEEHKEHVPNLEDPGIRPRVVEVWKTMQARDLALAEAKRLAGKARQSKGPLKDSLKQGPNVKIFDPKPFTWLTEGQVPRGMPEQGQPRYSAVEGAPGAEYDFMHAAFSLEAGGVGVATNHPKSEVYVIRADQFSPSTEVLWAMFTNEDYGRYSSAAFYNQRALYLSWMDEIKHSAAMQWNREADRREESDVPIGAPEPIEMPEF